VKRQQLLARHPLDSLLGRDACALLLARHSLQSPLHQQAHLDLVDHVKKGLVQSIFRLLRHDDSLQAMVFAG
jgi:hypothetical protein